MMHPFPSDNSIVFWPDAVTRRRAVVTRYMQRFGAYDLEGLCAAAERRPEEFWSFVLEDIGWRWRQPPVRVLDVSRGFPWARWFVGGEVNVVDCVLPPDRQGEALIWEGEDGGMRSFTWPELRSLVLKVASGLLHWGVRKGDRIALLMPMIPETYIAFLASAALGAIAVPIFSGYGVPAIARRLQDSGAKALITADGFLRRGSEIDLLASALAATQLSPSVTRVVVVPRMGRRLPDGLTLWEEVERDGYAEPSALPADAPLMIIYTSGTTGRPKGAVHSHSGFPVKAACDMRLCFDVAEQDTLFWLTDMGWMMGPWSILGTGILGAKLLLYEGAIDYPHPDRLWSLVERYRVSVFGISPTVIRSLAARGDQWVKAHDLSSLRILGSSGEPWNPSPWHWYFRTIGGGRLPIINYSGGTEISGGIIGSFVTEAIKPCSFHGPIPGMAARVLNEDGHPARMGRGELAIVAPWVGMTQGFWNDYERYLETYWSRIPNVWIHGDAAYIDEDGYWYILGRSDDTINTAGKRVSPAEVESAAVAHPSVREAAAIAIPDAIRGEGIALFVVLREGIPDSKALRQEIGACVVEHLGKTLAPQAIYSVPDLPRTRSGKIVRRAVRARHLGMDPGDLSTLENPECLRKIPVADCKMRGGPIRGGVHGAPQGGEVPPPQDGP